MINFFRSTYKLNINIISFGLSFWGYRIIILIFNLFTIVDRRRSIRSNKIFSWSVFSNIIYINLIKVIREIQRIIRFQNNCNVVRLTQTTMKLHVKDHIGRRFATNFHKRIRVIYLRRTRVVFHRRTWSFIQIERLVFTIFAIIRRFIRHFKVINSKGCKKLMDIFFI